MQAGAYQDPEKATRAQKTLTLVHPHVSIIKVSETLPTLYRVRLGPFIHRAEAERVAREVQARGYAAVVIPMEQSTTPYLRRSISTGVTILGTTWRASQANPQVRTGPPSPGEPPMGLRGTAIEPDHLRRP